MANVVEKTGKTVQEAVSLALADLNANADDVDVEVIEEGNKGIFGIIGSRQARVRVTLRESDGKIAVEFLQNIFEKMGVLADITVDEDESSVFLDIKGDDSGIIIGRRGETLDALQYLTSLTVNKGREDYKKVTIDIENYRQKREDTLIKLANRLADRVHKYKKSITLEPMNPYERKIIHSTLQDNRFVDTYSVGNEPNRKVVITLK